jgi:hypothetical protein
MKNLQKDFLPFELSLKMKQLGFDEPCMYYVDEQNNSFIYNFQTYPDEFIEWCGVTVISTPLYQQAFRWFREKYTLIYFIGDDFGGWSYSISKNSKPQGSISAVYSTYEEAELECLKKLIEIIENK